MAVLGLAVAAIVKFASLCREDLLGKLKVLEHGQKGAQGRLHPVAGR
jgi:hypothetical protein